MEEKEVVESKICKACLKVKNITSFTKCPMCKDGYQPRCKLCVQNRVKIKRENRAPKTHTDPFIMYGLTKDDWRQMYKIMQGFGYDLNRSIHEQFLEKHNLQPKKKIKTFDNYRTPKELGLI